MQKKIPAITALAFLLFVHVTFANETPKIEQGIVDFTATNFDNGYFKIEGLTDFYWSEFILPVDIYDSLPGHVKLLAPIPKPWTAITQPDGQKLPAQGFGTYRFKIKVPNIDRVYALKIHSIFSSYAFYLNGNKLSQLGKLGTTIDESSPKFLTQEIPIAVVRKGEEKTQTLDVVLQVSNFHHRRAGIQQPMYFGTMDEVIDATEDTIILNLFLIGIILIIGLNHLLMYTLRRLDFGNFLFGILSLVMILRNLTTGERLLMHWFPNMSWELLIKLDNFSGFATMIFFALFFYFTFRKDFPKFMFYLLIGIGLLITLLVFSTDAWFYGQFRMVFEAYIGLGGLYLVFGVLMVAAIRQRSGGLVSFIGMFLLYATAINDILSSMGIISTAFIAPFGIAAFMVLQSYILTKKSALALVQNQTLSEELLQEKNNLEERIGARTNELSQQAEELKKYQAEQEQQNRINEGLNEITTVMRLNKNNVSTLADQLLSAMIKRVNGSMGAIYLEAKTDSGSKLKLLANYGLNADAKLDYLDVNEGLTGKCFSNSKPITITDIPERYFAISSGLGSATPHVLILLPLCIDELVIGVVEIASFKSISKTHELYLTRALENIAAQLNIVKMNEESLALIQESKKVEQEARNKAEELTQNLEELRDLKEESEKKELQIERLLNEAQQREQEMQEKVVELESQNRTIQQKLEELMNTTEDLKPKPKRKKAE